MTEKDRINRVITRSGDNGTSGLADGSRLAKDAPVFVAMGDIDELSAALGELCQRVEQCYLPLLQQLQQDLFEIGAELAIPNSTRLPEQALLDLEQHADTLNTTLPPLKEFILPGGNPAASWCHYCRTVARRAERALIRYATDNSVNAVSQRYLNRLSDLLFILARRLNRDAGVVEPQWQPRSATPAKD